MLVEQTDIQAIISISGEEDILTELESEARNKIVDRRISQHLAEIDIRSWGIYCKNMKEGQ